MEKNQRYQEECNLVVYINKFLGDELKYEFDKIFSNTLFLDGIIDDNWYEDYYYKQSSKFHRKHAVLNIYSPPSKRFLEEAKISLIEDPLDLCGVVRVNAELETERYEYQGKIKEIPPISIDLHVNLKCFESIKFQILNALSLRMNIKVKLVLVADVLKKIERSKSMPMTIKPRELDISVFNWYGVKDFEIFTILPQDTEC